MSVERIISIDDPRVAAYRNLRDRTLRGENLFVAEGRWLVERLLASRFTTESLLVSEGYAEEFIPKVGGRVPVYAAAEHLLREVVGFPFHRGVLAAGRRGPALSLEGILNDAVTATGGTLRLAVLPEVTKPENLGLVFRSAAAFGLTGVLLGERSCDPLSRRCLRTSMGAALVAPFVKVGNLAAALAELKERWGVALLATVLDPSAEEVQSVAWPERLGLVVGNEAEGLAPVWQALCERRVTIPVACAVDSLNLGVAASIVFYEMTRSAGRPPGLSLPTRGAPAQRRSDRS